MEYQDILEEFNYTIETVYVDIYKQADDNRADFGHERPEQRSFSNFIVETRLSGSAREGRLYVHSK